MDLQTDSGLCKLSLGNNLISLVDVKIVARHSFQAILSRTPSHGYLSRLGLAVFLNNLVVPWMILAQRFYIHLTKSRCERFRGEKWFTGVIFAFRITSRIESCPIWDQYHFPLDLAKSMSLPFAFGSRSIFVVLNLGFWFVHLNHIL